MQEALLWAAAGTGFTFFMTALGAAVVFFFRGEIRPGAQRIFLGFAAGVMIAASVWSLLIPAIEEAEAAGTIGFIPAAGGFILGVAFLMLLDSVMPHLHPGGEKEGMKSSLGNSALLLLAVTLHNIPEGMAVGLTFALASQQAHRPELYMSALVLALGMGIQNFPEGTAVALPLRKEGLSPRKAFLWGSASGIVEPIFGTAVVLCARFIQPAMPWMLSFAAGAMLYVVVEELIPQAHLGEHSHAGTLGVMTGFLLMMILDVALG